MNKKNRKPLIIQGARQVGKTWIMKEFGARFYENTVYINFDNNKAMKDVFDLDFDLKRILSAIKIEYGKSFQAENTLIIFDEIQEAPKALASMRMHRSILSLQLVPCLVLHYIREHPFLLGRLIF